MQRKTKVVDNKPKTRSIRLAVSPVSHLYRIAGLMQSVEGEYISPSEALERLCIHYEGCPAKGQSFFSLISVATCYKSISSYIFLCSSMVSVKNIFTMPEELDNEVKQYCRDRDYKFSQFVRQGLKLALKQSKV